MTLPTVSTRTLIGGAGPDFAVRNDDITDGIIKFAYRSALMAPGGWSLTIRSDHPAVWSLLQSNSGIVVNAEKINRLHTVTNHVTSEFSGPTNLRGPDVQCERLITPGSDVMTFQGTCDLGVLWRFGITPPSGGTHRTIGPAPIQAVVRDLLLALLVPVKLQALDPVALVWSGAEPSVILSSRYKTLGLELVKLVEPHDCHVIARIIKATGSTSKVRVTTEPYRTTNFVVSIDRGTAKSIRRVVTSSIVTTPTVLGAGVGAAREVVALEDSSTEPWGRKETFLDRRDIAAGDTTALTAAAQEAIDIGGVSYEVELSDNVGELHIGDKVWVELMPGDGLEEFLITEVYVELTPTRHQRRYTLGRQLTWGLLRLIARDDVADQPQEFV